MNLLYSDRPEIEQNFIKEVCNDILSTSNQEKPKSNQFAGIFVEGRNRQINTLEDTAAIMSFKRFSKYNYPVYCFINNNDDFLHRNLLGQRFLDFHNIHFIKIDPLNSLEAYTEFCIKKLYFLLPPEIENVITLQPDGMLLKSGWEDFILNSNCAWLSSHWQHYAQIDWKINDKWHIFTRKTAIGNGGFSFRKKSILIELSKAFGSNLLNLREYGREDNRIPMEDLFFSGIMNTIYNADGKFRYKMPTLKQCDEFSCDPLTLDIWNNKEKLPFGFHYFRTKSEFPICNHG
jgi:hypothetical protein